MVDHPAARALTGFLLVRGGVHQVAYARAVEHLTGADLSKLFPAPRIPTDKIPQCKPHIRRGDHLRLYRFSPKDYLELAAVFNGPHSETGKTSSSSTRRRRVRPRTTCRRNRPSSRPTTHPRRSGRSPPGCGSRPGSPTPRRAKSRTETDARSEPRSRRPGVRPAAPGPEGGHLARHRGRPRRGRARPDELPDSAARAVMERAGVDRLQALTQSIETVCRGGTISIIGVYGGTADPLNMLQLFDKGREAGDGPGTRAPVDRPAACRSSPQTTTRSASRTSARSA
jgi:Manganese containing catalase